MSTRTINMVRSSIIWNFINRHKRLGHHSVALRHASAPATPTLATTPRIGARKSLRPPPKKPPTPASKDSQGSKSDSKPFPTSVVMAGYVAGALTVPYVVGNLVAELRSLRSFIEERGGNGGRRFVDFVRQYFGHHDHIAYGDESKDIIGFPVTSTKDAGSQHADSHKPHPMSFANEPCSRVREKRSHADQRLKQTVKVSVQIYKNGGDVSFEETPVAVLQGEAPGITAVSNVSTTGMRTFLESLKVSPKDAPLLEKVLKDASGQNYHLTVEFLHDAETEDDGDNQATFGADSTIDVSDGTSSDGHLVDDSLHKSKSNISDVLQQDAESLRKETAVYSTWLYLSPNMSVVQDQASVPTTKPSTAKEEAAAAAKAIETALAASDQTRSLQLEWEIEQLQKELNDPNSMRDRDEMTAELKAMKAELRKLKGSWW